MQGDPSGREPQAGTALTRRQQIAQLLRLREHGFGELCQIFALSVRELEEELRHVERSARRGPSRMQVIPSSCLACGFVFQDRARRHLHPPGRCPRCRSERITEPRFAIPSGNAPQRRS